jgi:hypoxanthine phosphoribosyltransferase
MMDIVKFEGLVFSKYIDAKEIQKRIHELARLLNKDLNDRNPVFLVILNGAFIFAADLLRCIDFPHEVLFVDVKSYQGMASTGEVKIDQSNMSKLTSRNVVIVEDIIDSGKTLFEFVQVLEKFNVKNTKIITLLLKPKAIQYAVDCQYSGFSIPNSFVVGFGLDYNDWGRSLPHIYQLVPPSIE